MKITYLGHSGFLAEVEGIYLLFDYYCGELPKLPQGSRLYVFVSHRHEDHFNPQIFQLSERYQVTFFLAYDIKLNVYGMRRYGITEECREKIVSIRFGEDRTVDGLRVRTLQSTDSGVAFLVSWRGRHIYHAGDHNWWHWDGEDKCRNNNVAANYKRGIAWLAEEERRLDAAFVPLDPRLGESYYYGLKYFCEAIDVPVIFPMHFGREYDCQKRFVEDFGYRERIAMIEYPGQVFSVCAEK